MNTDLKGFLLFIKSSSRKVSGPASPHSRGGGVFLALLMCAVLFLVLGLATRPAVAAADSAFTCAPGYVYSQQSNGSLKEYNGSVSNLPAWGSSYSDVNGLGIGSEGAVAYAYVRVGSNPGNISRLLKYTASSGQWSEVADSSYATGLSGSLVTGAVNLANGNYLFGGFQTIGGSIVFQLYEYSVSTGSYLNLGYFNTGETSGRSNGDMAFDSAGNLYVVRSGDTTSIYTVSASELKSAENAHNGGREINAQKSTSGTISLQNVNGIAFDSDGTIYLGNGTQLAHYNPTTWQQIGNILTSSLGSSTDLASCNSPSTLTVKKNLPGGRAATADQFRLSVSQSSGEISSAVTSGQSTGIQQAQVGPVVAVAGQSYTFGESMASGSSSSMDAYQATWQCVNENDGSVTSRGNGVSGSVTIPRATGKGAAITCTVTNTPKKDGGISWSKVDSTDASKALAGSAWELTGPTAGDSSTRKVEDCVAADASSCTGLDKDPAAGKFLVNGLVWGTYSLKETAAPAGYELSDQVHQVVVNASTTIDVGAIGNKAVPRASLTMRKTILSASGERSPGVDWSMNASLSTKSPAGTALLGTVTKKTAANGSVADAWPITFSEVSQSAVVSVAEIQQQGYEFSSGSCVVTAADGTTSTIPLTGTSGDVAGITPGSSTSCELVNKQLTGTATWSKTADDGHPLQGSVWTLTFPDGHTQDITGDEQGRFSAGSLPWGQFTLVEKEAPAGYKVDDTKHTFTIDATHLNVNAIDSQSGAAVNAKQDVPGLPMTGGTSTDMFMILGVALLILAAAFGGWYVLSTRRQARHQSGARH